jgi:hypothetical protein
MSNAKLELRPVTPAIFVALAAMVVVAFSHTLTLAQSPVIDPKIDAILQRMSKTLAEAKTFSVNTGITVDDLLDSGQKVQTSRTEEIFVRRPDGVAATVAGDNLNLNFVYDGSNVLLYNLDKPAYALVKAPGTIDAMFDMLADDYGVVVPLADFLSSDPYHALTEHVQSAQDLGLGFVNDAKCFHLAFRQETVDWQIWIDQGEVATPRKIVITYKQRPESPQFTAVFSKWNLSAQPAADAFTITPPANVPRSDLVKVPPTTQPATQP